MTEQAENLLEQILVQLKQPPVEQRLWDYRDIAAYTGYEASYVEKTVVYDPDFPEPAQLLKKSRRRVWLASHVMNWATRHLKKRPARRA